MRKFVVRRPKAAESVDRAIEISNQINADTERLNDGFAKADAKLQGLNLGVAASVPFEDDASTGDDGELPHAHRLWFRRLPGGWGLAVQFGTYVQDEEDDFLLAPPNNFQPIRNASREDRLEAAKLLPALVDALVKEAEKKHDSFKEALSALDAFVGGVQVEVSTSDDDGGGA